MIYYGDEVGMSPGNDPDDRKPMIWPEIQYADEKYNPDGTTRNPDRVSVNQELLRHYRKLIRIRHQNPALSLGDYETLLADDKAGTFAFSRTHEGRRVVVVLNTADQAQAVSLPATSEKIFADVLNDSELSHDAGRITLTVPAKWGAILQAE
jgi:glycosidase